MEYDRPQSSAGELACSRKRDKGQLMPGSSFIAGQTLHVNGGQFLP
jgi:hypothetical protein